MDTDPTTDEAITASHRREVEWHQIKRDLAVFLATKPRTVAGIALSHPRRNADGAVGA